MCFFFILYYLPAVSTLPLSFCFIFLFCLADPIPFHWFICFAGNIFSSFYIHIYKLLWITIFIVFLLGQPPGCACGCPPLLTLLSWSFICDIYVVLYVYVYVFMGGDMSVLFVSVLGLWRNDLQTTHGHMHSNSFPYPIPFHALHVKVKYACVIVWKRACIRHCGVVYVCLCVCLFYRNHNKQGLSGVTLAINKHNNNNKHSVSLNNRENF